MSILQLCWIAVTAVTIIFLIVAALSALPKMKTAFTAVIAAVFLAAGGITAFGSIAPLLPGAVAGLLPAAHAATTVRLPPAPAPGVPLSGDASAGRVTFTFDDGPDVNTPAVIAELNELHLHGVFFLIGDKAAKRPATVAAELANGEVIGNHTWDHKSLTGKGTGTRPLSQAQVRTELSRADAAIVTAGAPEPSLWRPPYGAVNAADDATARALGLRVVLDSGTNIIDSNDWAGLTPAQIARRVDPVLRNATIIAFHDGLRTAPAAIRALPLIVAYMNAHHLGATTTVRPNATGGVVPYAGPVLPVTPSLRPTPFASAVVTPQPLVISPAWQPVTEPAPGTVPAASTPAPARSSPAPAPSTRTPAPAPSTTTPAPVPSTTSPAPAPSTTPAPATTSTVATGGGQ